MQNNKFAADVMVVLAIFRFDILFRQVVRNVDHEIFDEFAASRFSVDELFARFKIVEHLNRINKLA